METKMTLYNLTEEYLNTRQLVENESEDYQTALDQIEGNLIVKYENIGKLVLTLTDEVQEITKTAEAFTDRARELLNRAQVKENAINRLMQYLQENFRQAQIEQKFNYPLFDLGIEKMKPKVVVDNEAEISNKFMTTPKMPTPQPDLKAILDWWKEHGKNPKGVHIADNRKRLVIRSGRNIIASSEGYTENNNESKD